MSVTVRVILAWIGSGALAALGIAALVARDRASRAIDDAGGMPWLR